MDSPHVVNVTERTFETEVLDYSMRTPVIVDFWATWCGPCKTLGPLLETLADEYGGAFRLAKIDVDQNPRLAQGIGIQSIPTMVAVFGGGRVDQLVGAHPRGSLTRWIDNVLLRAGVERPPAEVKVPTDPARAEAHWRAALAKDADDGHALCELGRIRLDRGDPEEAKRLLEQVSSESDHFARAQTLISVMSLMGEVAEAGGEEAVRARLAAEPVDIQAAYLAACVDASKGRFREALSALVELVARTKGDLKDKVRSAAGLAFSAAGREDPEIERLRRRLATLLY